MCLEWNLTYKKTKYMLHTTLNIIIYTWNKTLQQKECWIKNKVIQNILYFFMLFILNITFAILRYS